MHIFIIMILWQRPYAQNVSEIVSGDPQKFDFSRETKIQQTFIARNDYLRGLGIKLRNFYTQSRDDLTTTLLMGDVIIYSEKTNLANLVIPSFYRIFFTPIPDSSSKKFTLILETDTPAQTPVALYVAQSKDLSSFIVNGRETDKSVYLYTSYQNMPKNNNKALGVWGVIGRISQYKPWVFKGVMVYVFMGLYLTVIGYFLYSFFSKPIIDE